MKAEIFESIDKQINKLIILFNLMKRLKSKMKMYNELSKDLNLLNKKRKIKGKTKFFVRHNTRSLSPSKDEFESFIKCTTINYEINDIERTISLYRNNCLTYLFNKYNENEKTKIEIEKLFENIFQNFASIRSLELNEILYKFRKLFFTAEFEMIFKNYINDDEMLKVIINDVIEKYLL